MANKRKTRTTDRSRVQPTKDGRLEGAWIAFFSSAISGYVPPADVADEQSSDAREEQYVEDVINYAENVAANGLAAFAETFGGRLPETIIEQLEGEEEEEEEENDDEEEEDEDDDLIARR